MTNHPLAEGSPLRHHPSRTADAPGRRPVMVAIAGDSASGKTTLARGLAEAIGEDRCTSISVDDYHRYTRAERRSLGITPLDPRHNHIDIMEQHLQLLALGQPILKPVYDHRDGTIRAPEYVVPSEFVIVEGLFPLHTKLARACFDLGVYLDPPEAIRHAWKVARDTAERGYTEEEVRRELALREPDSEAYIRPQRRDADIVIRFAAEDETGAADGSGVPATAGSGPLSAELLLRPTIPHPSLINILTDDVRAAMQMRIIRDVDGTPVDALEVHGRAQPGEMYRLKQAIWEGVSVGRPLPTGLGATSSGDRSESLAITQLLLLYHLRQPV